MMSLGLAAAFTLEAVVALLVCAWVWDFSVIGMPIGVIAVVVVAVSLLLRVLMVLVEFVCAYIWATPREPEERIGVLRTVQMMASEVYAFLVMFCFLTPLARRLVAPRRAALSSAGQAPVLLIHGYMCNAGIWAPMLTYLRQRGLANLFTLNLLPKYGDLDDYAQQVAARVSRICDITGAPRVVLVGHGTGGLVARCYVERCGGGAKVAKVISISAPHHGTMLARLARGQNAEQIRVNSAWLADINRGANQLGGPEHVTIYSTHDNVIVPQHNAELGKARNIRVVGKGHFSMLFCKKIGQLVYREIIAA